MDNTKYSFSYKVLYIYEKLTNKEHINCATLINQFNCNRRSALRLINEVRFYLYDTFSGLDIEFDYNKNTYILTKNWDGTNGTEHTR